MSDNRLNVFYGKKIHTILAPIDASIEGFIRKNCTPQLKMIKND
jgi:hypothetical protein